MPKLADALFFVFAAGTLGAAAGVALFRNILHSALSLLATLLGVASLYIWLKADFVAVTQLLIYVGGVLVLILFALMLTSRIGTSAETNPALGRIPATVLCVALFGVLTALAYRAPWRTSAGVGVPESTAERIGDLFLAEYLLPFEVASLLLLATLVAAVVVARKEAAR